MKKANLGGLEVGRLGLGAMTMAGTYTSEGDLDDSESIRTIHRALELGVTHIDTAEVYGPFHSEEIVGQAVKGRRDELQIATKFGILKHEADGTVGSGPDGSPANIRRAVEGSLTRLGTDYIDLFYQHRMDPNTPIEETVGALAELVAEGKIRHYGLSEASAATIRRAHAVHPTAALQTEYSLWTRDVEAEILPVLRELGIGFVPYSPLGHGLLTGQIRSVDDFPDNDWRKSTRASPAKTSPATWRSSTRSGRSAPRSAPPQLRRHWRGFSPRVTTSRRSPVPDGALASRRTSRPTASNSARVSSSAWTTSPPRRSSPRRRKHGHRRAVDPGV